MNRMIFEHLEQYAEKIALIHGNVAITYRQLLQLSEEYLQEIPRRSVVLFVCENTLSSVILYVGMMRKEIIPVMISPNIKKEAFQNLVDLYHPNFIIYGKEEVQFEYLNKQMIPTDPQLALLLTTSGSTGSSKYVRLSYKNIIANTNSIVEYLRIQSRDRVITTLPMCYTYGLSLVQTHLYKGASIVIYNDTVLDHSFRKEIDRNQVTNFGGVPFTYEMLYKSSFFKHVPESIKYMTQAGDKLSKELNTAIVKHCKEQQKKFFVMYGQTEATARISYVPWEDAERKIGSIGVPIPNGYMELHDEMDKIILESCVPGEIIYKGANVMMGYAEKQSDLNKGENMEGILHTGDLAYKDEEGFYFITGRKSRYVKLYGLRTNLNDIEKHMKRYNITAFCAGRDNHINIYLVESISKEQVANILKNSFAIRSRDFSIFYISHIPRTESGKIDYTKLDTYIV